MGVQNLCLLRVIDTRASRFVITSPMLAKSDRQPFGLSLVPNADTVCSPENPTSKAAVYLLFVLLPVVLGRSLYVLLICQRNEDQLRINLSRSDTLSIGSQRNKAKRATFLKKSLTFYFPSQLVANEKGEFLQKSENFSKNFSIATSHQSEPKCKSPSIGSQRNEAKRATKSKISQNFFREKRKSRYRGVSITLG